MVAMDEINVGVTEWLLTVETNRGNDEDCKLREWEWAWINGAMRVRVGMGMGRWEWEGGHDP